MTPAKRADLPEIDAFLEARVESSMFLLANLRDFGWDSDAPYAMRYWVQRRGGAISDVLGLSNTGMLMAQMPNADWTAAAAALEGEDIAGLLGLADQMRPLQQTLDLNDASASLNRDEPFMVLDLADLQVPDGPGRIVPVIDAPKETIVNWMTAYQYEALHTASGDAETQALGSYHRYVDKRSHVVLMDGDTPLAMTGFNARLPGIVQIGGVYTPPEHRNRGHARRALALHLAEAAADGVTRSVLFSGSDAAQRAYEGIGYRQIGHWTLCLFENPQVIHG